MSRRRAKAKRGPEPADAARGGGRPWLDPDAVRPGLLLLAGGFEAAAAEAALATGVARAVVAAAADLAGWREPCRRHAVALLGLDEASAGAADGLHLADAARTAAARERLGPEAILGVACGRSRHAAMVAGEAGADYVMFDGSHRPAEPDDGPLGLVGWWNELFVIPCAAEIPPEPDRAGALVAAGADLVAVRLTPGARVEALAAAIRAARA